MFSFNNEVAVVCLFPTLRGEVVCLAPTMRGEVVCLAPSVEDVMACPGPTKLEEKLADRVSIEPKFENRTKTDIDNDVRKTKKERRRRCGGRRKGEKMPEVFGSPEFRK